MTRTKLTGAFIGLLVLVAAWQALPYTSQSVANPRRIDRALGDEGTRQVIIQAWWSPGSATADMQWRIGELSQGTKKQTGATPRLPFERRGRVRRGEPVFLGWSMTAPGPFAYMRYRVWLSGQVVKEGESKVPTMTITAIPWT